jgi:hypothetical protein
MVIALAGRRIDAPGSSNPQFPPHNIAAVRARLREFFGHHAVSALVSSAACGADLLALEAASHHSIPFRIVLPFDLTRFRETSVADRPGNWVDLFDGILNQANARHDVLVLPSRENDHAAYATVNHVILAEAGRLGHYLREEVAAVLVWNGTPSGEPDDLTQAFGDEARRLGFAVSELSTLDG